MAEQALLQILLGEFHDNLNLVIDLTHRSAQFPQVANKIQVAIGMRRTGKTYFIYHEIIQLLQKIPLSQILYINFEDDRLLPCDSQKLSSLIDAFYALYPENHDKQCYIFLDEIQNVENWPIVVRRLFDSKKMKLYLTGSSAKLLSKEIATSLRGRSLSTEIWPYSFEEYLVAKNISLDRKLFHKKLKDQMTQLYEEYLTIGGFPETIDYSPEMRQRTLQDYTDLVVYRDIIERHEISNPTVLRKLIQVMMHNIGKPFSINKFYNDLKSQGYKTSKDSLYDYLGYIEDAYLAFSIPLYSKSIRKVQSNPKKIYAIDTGLINALTLQYNEDWGRLFENAVYLDLRRNGFDVSYYLTEQRFEVDFLVQTRRGEKTLLQVTWDMRDKNTLEREIRALEQAKLELKVPGKIITLESYLKDGLLAFLDLENIK